ncbi:MAG: putative glycoside hydrolase family 15 protein, partial [candidate division KSB1 bacterium]|nr:putative glycoside hydrolase family 15 protein [candidate division KSB1 bacterium]
MKGNFKSRQVCQQGVCLFVLTLFALWNLISGMPTRAEQPSGSRLASSPSRQTIRFPNGLPNHRYPRVATFQWSGAPPEWYAKHDLVDIGDHDPALARAIKTINPNTIILPTQDWNAGAGIDPLPDQWITRNSLGKKINLYGPDTWYVDITDFCPRVNGKRYNEALPDQVLSRIDLTVFDGVATDGLWSSPYSANGDIDLDRNGVNDFKEHGGDWVSDQLVRGIEKVLAGFRSRMAADKLILVNSGGFHSFGWEYSNGVLMEHTSFLYSFGWFKGQLDGFMRKAPTPHVIIIDGNPSEAVSFTPKPSKNDFRLMRFLLGCALLGDAYISFTDIEAGEHYYTKYYDEYDVDLGYPTGPATELRSDIWVRFFDLGAMVLNASGAPKTVTDAEL